MSYLPYTESVINYYKSLEKEFKLRDVELVVVVERKGDKNLEEILKKLYILNHTLIITKKPGDDFISDDMLKLIPEPDLRELKHIGFSSYPEIDNIECNEYILLITKYCILPLPSFNTKTNINKYKELFNDEITIKGAMTNCIVNKNIFTYTIKSK